jgi:hypothetical protein
MACPDGSAICGISVLALAQVDLPEGMRGTANSPIEVQVPPPPGSRPRRPELAVYQERDMPLVWESARTGLRAVNLPHCWAQVTRRRLGGGPAPSLHIPEPAERGQFLDGRKRSLLECVQLGDALMRRQRPLVSHDEFSAYINQLAGSRHVRLIRDVFRYLRPGTDSPNETWLRLLVIDAGFPLPVVNYEIRSYRGSRFLDLSWPDRMVALEYQGSHHFADSVQSREDLDRRGQLQASGWVVVEAAYRDLLHPAELIGRLTAALAG